MRNKKFWKNFAILAAVIIATLLIFVLLVSGIVMAIRPSVRGYKYVDLSILHWFALHTTPALTKVMLFFTDLGQHQLLVPLNIILILYFLFVRKHTWLSIRIAAIALSSLALMLTLKELFMRHRPVDPLLHAVQGMSFPSGHALMSMTFYGLMMYIIATTLDKSWWRNLALLLMGLLILMIGFSRVYIRVHYASDVLAGFVIGLLWLALSLSVLKRLEWKLSGSRRSMQSFENKIDSSDEQ